MAKKLVITGITGATSTTPVARHKIPEHRKGWFGYDVETSDDGITVTIPFVPVLYVDKDLSKDELAPVIKHERVHEADFQHLAGIFKTKVTAAFKKDDTLDLEPWLDWLKYDVNQASIAYHRKIDETDLTQNFAPKSPRPK
jgi:hypothetical protein